MTGPRPPRERRVITSSMCVAPHDNNKLITVLAAFPTADVAGEDRPSIVTEIFHSWQRGGQSPMVSFKPGFGEWGSYYGYVCRGTGSKMAPEGNRSNLKLSLCF